MNLKKFNVELLTIEEQKLIQGGQETGWGYISYWMGRFWGGLTDTHSGNGYMRAYTTPAFAR